MSRAQENYVNKRKNQQNQQASYNRVSMPPQPFYPPPQLYTLPNGQQVMPMMDMTGGFPQQQQGKQTGAPTSQTNKEQEEQDADPERVKNILPIYGSSSTFNINTLLYNNIMEADYFKALYQLRTYHEIVGTSTQKHVHRTYIHTHIYTHLFLIVLCHDKITTQ